MSTYANSNDTEVGGMIFTLAVVAAFMTSIINCIMTGKWILLVVDLFVAPVAVIHGVMVWFGVG